MYLFHSNRRPQDAPFLTELQAAAKQNSKFRFIPTMTQLQSSDDWTGERGFIDQSMITRHLSSLRGPIYYVAGPPAMVTAMRQMLMVAGADEDDIRTEEFAGY